LLQPLVLRLRPVPCLLLRQVLLSSDVEKFVWVSALPRNDSLLRQSVYSGLSLHPIQKSCLQPLRLPSLTPRPRYQPISARPRFSEQHISCSSSHESCWARAAIACLSCHCVLMAASLVE